MQCPQCQHDNPTGARFCNGCGAKLEATCPECGQVNPPGSRFCNGCGKPLDRTAAPSTPAPSTSRFTSPESYTPQHLAERIISSRGALEGERKQVTVLFADLKGSTALIQGLDPEEVHALLHPALQLMMDAVHRYEGTVNQLLGDGLMALFGAPVAHEDHAVRACYAALALQEGMRQHTEQVRRSRGLELQARVGLNSGEVLVTAVGNDLHMEYTAVGQPTHLAARMEQLATPGTVRLMPETLRLVEGLVQVRSLGPMPVQGLSEPVEIYELVGAAPTRSRLHAAAARGLTRFVGRDAELETLGRTLAQATAGHGQIVALVGEPGVGKSRLVWEFTHSHRAQDWLVLAAGSVSYGKAHSWLPVSDLLRAYFQIEPADDHRRMRQKVLGRLLDLDRTLESLVPPLLALLDVPVEEAAWETLDPPQRRQRTLDAVKRLLLRESQEQPLLLVFEDLHWIDAETQALLDSLVDSLPTARLLLLVNYRPEYAHGWHRKTYYQQLRLDPLAPDSAEELLRALLGDAGELQPLKRLLIERTEGNPFFVEESVRALVESGVLAGERGAYQLARPFQSTQVPATVQAVLAARIDRLAPEDKRLLQAAAVIGKDVPYALLLAIAELPDEALRQGLARLQTAEFLYEAALFPEQEYTFKHALTHEVVYGGLLSERRRALHGRILEAIERLYPDRLVEYVERLAHHALRGEVWEQAVNYLRQAGDKAAARSAYREAVSHLDQAIKTLDHLSDGARTRELAVDLRLELYTSLMPLGEHDRTTEMCRELESLAEALGDPARLVRVYALIMARLRRAGDYERSLELAKRALAAASTVRDQTVQANIAHNLGMAYFGLGDYLAALDCFQQVMGLASEEGAFRQAPLTYSVVARAWAAACLAALGEFAEAGALAQHALRAAEATNLPWDLAMTLWYQGEVCVEQGAFAKAVGALERGAALCESAGVAYHAQGISTILGYAYALSGRAAEAVVLLEAVGRQPDEPGMGIGESRRVTYLAESYLLLKRTREAAEAAQRAIALARRHKERGNEVWALRLLGEIAANAEPPDAEQAESFYRQAQALAEELGMKPLAAHCHLGLGTLYQRVGRQDDAQAELTTAAELYRTMEMPYWLEKADLALAEART